MNLSMLSELEEKKNVRLPPVRVDERVAAAIDELMQSHGPPALSFGEYIRGLVYVDGLLSGTMPENADVPRWVRLAYPQLLKREKGGTNDAIDEVSAHIEREHRRRVRKALLECANPARLPLGKHFAESQSGND